MKEPHDPWFVRLPDGRVLNAKSSASVRHHVEAGNIPLNSSARRSAAEHWTALAKIAEFEDLMVSGNRSLASMKEIPSPPSNNGSSPEINLKSGVSGRLDPLRLQTVGIRGLVDELIAALDSTINSRKLIVAGLGGIAIMVSGLLIHHAVLAVYPEGGWLSLILTAGFGFFLLAGIVALLTRQTHLELSTMRPVASREAVEGLSPFVSRLFVSYIGTLGVGVAVWHLFQELPRWLHDWTQGLSPVAAEAIVTSLGILGLLVALVIGHMVLLSWLIAPVLVVEDCSVGDALREWRTLLREHRVRVLVYEGMALALALIAALPVALPVFFALIWGPALDQNWVGKSVQAAAVGLAMGPAMAFLTVANLFIYLNLRYEYTPQK